MGLNFKNLDFPVESTAGDGYNQLTLKILRWNT